MEFAYTVDEWCTSQGMWYPAYRNGKGQLFSSLSGCKSYINRQNKRSKWDKKPLGLFRINKYHLELVSTEERV